jgi:hypothetical protein
MPKLSGKSSQLNTNNYCIVSYNMHGLNNGSGTLYQLCCDSQVMIIAIQEHWLTP